MVEVEIAEGVVVKVARSAITEVVDFDDESSDDLVLDEVEPTTDEG